jgi:hypothetical protein
MVWLAQPFVSAILLFPHHLSYLYTSVEYLSWPTVLLSSQSFPDHHSLNCSLAFLNFSNNYSIHSNKSWYYFNPPPPSAWKNPLSCNSYLTVTCWLILPTQNTSTVIGSFAVRFLLQNEATLLIFSIFFKTCYVQFLDIGETNTRL